MAKSGWMRAGWIASGLLLLPVSAFAQTSGSTPMQGDNFVQPRAMGAQGSVRNVNATFQDTVADNCQYTATVRGTVREFNAAGATADNAVQFTPRLQIQAQLTCPNGSARQVSSYTLQGPQFGREQLAQAITEHARIFVSRGDQVCSYAPRLSFDAGRLASNGIAQSCMTQRGGGPRDIDQQQPSPFLGGTPSGVMAPPPGLGHSGGASSRPTGPTGGGPRNTIDQTDTMQGQHGVDPRTNPAFEPPPNGVGGTGRDVDTNPRSEPGAGIHNPVMP